MNARLDAFIPQSARTDYLLPRENRLDESTLERLRTLGYIR